MSRPIRRLLVANRGEIARRIFRTAHDMGISTVAVFAVGDGDAPFVAEADQAIALGGRTSAETYLDGAKILDAALRTGADAIHPGYGFLAENAGFARRVTEAGLTWVGPTSEAIAAMGDKLSAKRLMERAGVPTLPALPLAAGVDARAAAVRIGYPLLVKAAAGGGGKGMRVVEREADLEAAVEGARREAVAAFGDGTLFLERWLESARHVEIQLLGDQHGGLVHCFERECSIQRRHQKIIEEAPSPAVGPELRRRLGEAAVAAGRSIGYTSAGTVEFLLAGGEFFFLEMNTRLQVEHAVTEEVTGLDLVREQLRIAQGEPLGYGQDEVALSGHAIEARLYAEDPANGFLPTTGRLLHWQPSPSARARFDSGVESGSLIGIEFDPMLAKIVTHAPTRREAALRLARALETTRVQGLVTNRDFLAATLRTPEFLAGDTTTDFIERVEPALARVAGAQDMIEAALVAAMAAQHDRRQAAKVLRTLPSGWRNTVMPAEELVFEVPSASHQVALAYRIRRDGRFQVRARVRAGEEILADVEHAVELRASNGVSVELDIDGRRAAATRIVAEDRHLVHGPGGDLELRELPRFPSATGGTAAGGLVAPMPGKVVSVHVRVGEAVEPGQLLVVLEAMKMEHQVRAPSAGVVEELRVAAGDQVPNGGLLVVLSQEGAP